MQHHGYLPHWRGWQPEAFALTSGTFVRAATWVEVRPIVFILAEEDTASVDEALAIVLLYQQAPCQDHGWLTDVLTMDM